MTRQSLSEEAFEDETQSLEDWEEQAMRRWGKKTPGTTKCSTKGPELGKDVLEELNRQSG